MGHDVPDEIPILSGDARVRLELREALRERMTEVWNMRSRDVIEAPTDIHVNELLTLAVMPVLDEHWA